MDKPTHVSKVYNFDEKPLVNQRNEKIGQINRLGRISLKNQWKINEIASPKRWRWRRQFDGKPLGISTKLPNREAANPGCGFWLISLKTVRKSTKLAQPSGRIVPSKKLIPIGACLKSVETKFRWKSISNIIEMENPGGWSAAHRFLSISIGKHIENAKSGGCSAGISFRWKALVISAKMLNSGNWAAWDGFRCKTNGKSTKSHGSQCGKQLSPFVGKHRESQRNERKSAGRNLGLSASNFVEKAFGNQRNHMKSWNWRARHDFVENR